MMFHATFNLMAVTLNTLRHKRHEKLINAVRISSEKLIKSPIAPNNHSI